MLSWGKLVLTRRLFREVLPQVDAELTTWKARAVAIPDPILRSQALASLHHKRFHCEGGATFALFAQGVQVSALTKLIVAFQTISDYLDNLCDRSTSLNTRDYRWLHQAMLDAVIPGPPLTPQRARDYYREHPCQDDGGYLASLVETCRKQIAGLQGYDVVAPFVWRLTSLYVDLQVLKHGPKQWRERLLRAWYHAKKVRDEVDWHEFSAAAGSTLAVFALFALAGRERPQTQRVSDLLRAYFPWICGLHILLDYWINQDEDRIGGDLNFTTFYASPAAASDRLRYMLRESLEKIRRLPDRSLHETIVQGLPGLYLSDPKARQAGLKPYISSFLSATGLSGRLTYVVCRMRRFRQRHPEFQAPPLAPRV